MNIRKIELNNFKSYYGHNSIDFNKGLNVISGMIGTVKRACLMHSNGYSRILIRSLDKDSKS